MRTRYVKVMKFTVSDLRNMEQAVNNMVAKITVKNKTEVIKAYVVNKDFAEIELRLGELTDDERQIITDGCLINYYKYN